MLSTTTTVGTMASIIADVGTIVTAASGWIQTYAGVITGNPIIEMFVIVSFVGLAVGLIRRLIRM